MRTAHPMRVPVRLPVMMLAALAILAPVTRAAAQYAGQPEVRRTGGYGQGERVLGDPPRPAPPIAALVLEHGAELALADSQRTMLESIRRTQDSANRPWLARLDTLRSGGRPANPNDLSQEQRDQIAARRKATTEVLAGMRETNAEARQKVMGLLNPEQQHKAAELEKDARKKADDASREWDPAAYGSDRHAGGGRRHLVED